MKNQTHETAIDDQFENKMKILKQTLIDYELGNANKKRKEAIETYDIEKLKDLLMTYSGAVDRMSKFLVNLNQGEKGINWLKIALFLCVHNARESNDNEKT